MRKHIWRVTLIYSGFELLRNIGGAIPDYLHGKALFSQFRERNALLLEISGFVVFLLYSVLSFIIFQKWFRQDKRKAFLYWALSVIAIIIFRYLVEEKFYFNVFGFRNYFNNVPLLYYCIDNLYFAALYSGFGVIYFFVTNENQRRLEQSELQVENKQTQLSFLRSQVNPHFLFNSLNNIYSLVYQKSEKSLEAIAGLSEILRYMLYDNHDKVPLQKELDYLEKYIKLQSMRYEKPLPVEWECSGNISAVQLPPLLLVPFVENAFKHGDATHTLSIKTEVRDASSLVFSVKNKKGKQQKDAGGGIGLENIKKRLQLLYHDRYSLQIDDKPDFFIIKLQLEYA